MNKITRHSFLRQSLKAGALLMLAPSLPFSAGAAPQVAQVDEDFMKRLRDANDKQVELLLKTDLQKAGFSRKTGYDFATLAAAFSSPQSGYHGSADVVAALGKLTVLLQSAQSDDGTANFGNLESPPDTAFLLEPLSAGAFILVKNASPDLQKINSDVKTFIVRAGEALSTGGVHTPNHRWVICAALARLNALYPNKKYTDRIADWMGENVFQNSDGNYPERSRNYANVEDNSMITMARLLNKPALFAYARKNLETTYYYMDPDGELVVNDSRRQDQYTSKNIVSYYLHYRYMAIRDKSALFAGITRLIEGMKGFEEEVLNHSYFHFLEDPLLQQALPAASTPPVNFEKLFTNSHLLRIRRNESTTTLFGGIDWPLIIASGRSDSPNFFAFRKGEAVLKYLRLSTTFFSMGYFYSEGLRKEGSKYILHKKLTVPYYQPLPKNLRNAKGDYKLSPSIDDRFWNKMDFSHRPVSNVKTLDTTITFAETTAGNELVFEVGGLSGVQVTIELCFREGGKLSGVTDGGNQNSFLESGTGSYSFGKDAISFGPGTVAQKTISSLEGERYSTHFGTLRTDGMHVYLTGVTPFRHTLVFS